jgi:hypothetical protein
MWTEFVEVRYQAVSFTPRLNHRYVVEPFRDSRIYQMLIMTVIDPDCILQRGKVHFQDSGQDRTLFRYFFEYLAPGQPLGPGQVHFIREFGAGADSTH